MGDKPQQIGARSSQGRGRDTPPEGVEWLFRVASAQLDATTRQRDLALLTLLSDCGLRSQEAADLQLRDVDIDREHVTVRAGKGGRARRVPLEGTGTLRRLREYMALRRPEGAPSIGSDAEREPFLIGRRVDLPGQPWRPGMQTAAMRKRLAELRDVAVQKIAAQVAKERSLERIGELEDLARELAATSPHRLRHGLAYRLLESGATPAYVKTIFGHSRISTSLMYGKPTEQDVRAALARANSRPSRT
jgi:site-specific recombinase XerD